jgi:hypothetical protein
MLLSLSGISTPKPEIVEPDASIDPDDIESNNDDEPYLDNVWSEVDAELDRQPNSGYTGSEIS